jgi:hypothetical protein
MDDLLFMWPTKDILADLVFRPAAAAASSASTASMASPISKRERSTAAAEAVDVAQLIAEIKDSTSDELPEPVVAALDTVQSSSAHLHEWSTEIRKLELPMAIKTIDLIARDAYHGRWGGVAQAACRRWVLPSQASSSSSNSLNRGQVADLVQLCVRGGLGIHQACTKEAAAAALQVDAPNSRGAGKRAAAMPSVSPLALSACEVLISSKALDSGHRSSAAMVVLATAGGASPAQLCSSLSIPRLPALLATCCRLCRDATAAGGAVASFSQALAGASHLVDAPAAITALIMASRAALASQRADSRVQSAVRMAMLQLVERHGSSLAKATLRQLPTG